MEQEAEDVRRQLGSTNAAVVEQLVACHTPQLVQRAVNVGAGVINKISQACGRLRPALLRPGTQPFACRSAIRRALA